MAHITKISKIEAARRQIETAIEMYFSQMDIVSIHTLTCAAHEILACMSKKQGKKSVLLDHMKANIKPEKQHKFIPMLNKPRNFFKHLFPDPNEELKFSGDETDFFLWDTCLMYEELMGDKTNSMKIFVMWFIIENNDILTKSKHQSLAKEERGKYKSRSDFFRKMSEAIKI